MPQQILERELAEASKAKADGKIKVTVLTPGWGSSGYYSPKVVEDAAGLVAVGTPMYLDHASETERFDRPGRSVKDIAAKFVSEAKWDATAQELVAEAQLVPGPYREALVALEDSIGVSINASATDIRQGEAVGRKGRIIEGLAKIDSVDFVTRAGRGGKFTALLEAALVEDDVLHLDEATADDRMGHLRSAVRDTHGGDRKSAWVRDQDAEAKTVWFDVHDHTVDAPAKTFEQTYTVGKNDVDVSLTGDPVQVRPVTKYVPVNPAGPTPTKESKEDTMPQIEEARLRELEEASGRVPTLVSERDTAVRERDEARRQVAESTARTNARDKARARALASNSTLPPATVDRIVESSTRQVPLMQDLSLDEAALNIAVDAARTAEEAYLTGLASTTGTKIHGFGESAKDDSKVEESAPTTSPWGRDLTEQKTGA